MPAGHQRQWFSLLSMARWCACVCLCVCARMNFCFCSVRGDERLTSMETRGWGVGVLQGTSTPLEAWKRICRLILSHASAHGRPGVMPMALPRCDAV